jgi:hypothetical protein
MERLGMDKHHQTLLDELEDAEDEARRIRHWQWYICTVLTLGVIVSIGSPIALSILHSMDVNMGEGSPWITGIGIAATVGSGILLAFFLDEVVPTPHPAKEVKRIKRKIRDHVQKEVDKAIGN